MGDVVDDTVTTAGSLYLYAAFEYSVSRDTKIVNLICLVSCEPPQLEEMDCIENSSLRESSRCRLCGAVVRSCYSLGKDLKLQSGNRVRAVAENATQTLTMSECRRQASQLLGILADDTAWRRLATRSDRTKFARAVIRAVQASKINGVRLLAPWRERSARGLYDFVVGLATNVAAQLQKENYTFGFFLPQGLLEPDRFTTQLKKILNARHSVLFYPDFSVFWKTAAAARWTLPQDARGRSSNETTVNETDLRSHSFACHLLAPPAAASLRLARAGESRRSDAAAPDYDGGDFDYPPYHSYWPPATATDKRKDGKGGHHYHHRHRQGRRRYDDFVGDYDSYDYYGGKHDYKHEYDIVFPLLILIMAPLAVSAFLLPITASLMTNTFFLVNGATSAAIQGRRRRRSLRQLAPSAEELRNLEEVLLRAISKYGGFEEAVVPESVKRGVLST
ncbi:hypothetical protein V5799_025179 [Amblyomma americanum]|uniref:Uncharacterized protein n=1 Tax=Amblyomma americanum TaxID=6943 RepID=A0AAQ4E9X7_AMBAM